MKIRLEFKPRDLWIGAFLEKEHLWICAIPCFPIHFDWSENGVAEGIIGKQLSNTESNSNKEVRMPDEKKDMMIEYVECGDDFEFTVRDQEFFARQKDPKTGRPWDPPKRCKACRDARKQDRKSQGS